MNKKSVKLNYKESFVPYSLLEHIIKETDVERLTIEEEQSELYFETIAGYGKIFFRNNSVYEGYVKNGILDSYDNSRPSIIVFPNGTKYEGEIKNNQITGNGTYTFNTGSIYKGDVKNGLRHGYGVYQSPDGVKYEGNWQNGLKHGLGKITMSGNSMIYEGEWVEGIIQGQGKIKWVTGNFYEGEFKNNKINGNGYLIWYDTSEKYIGQWTDSLQNGLGIQIWYEAKGEQKYLRNRYVGEWRNGFRHGYGVFFYSNGSKYEGTWDQNYKHGYGVFTFYDGSQYVGRFHNDRMVDFNTSGLYAPSSLSKISDNRNISTANSKSGNPVNNKRVQNVNPIRETENENLVTSSNFNNINKLNTSSVSNVNGVSQINKNPQKGLEEIPENNESNIASPNKNYNLNSTNLNGNNPISNLSNTNNTNFNLNIDLLKKEQVVSIRAINNKDAELNQFKTSLDITDIIECEPDIENSLKEVENILLRHLTEMKDWYNKYHNRGKDTQKDDLNMTMNDNSRLGTNFLSKQDKEEKIEEKENKDKTQIAEGIYNNDLGFCLELKDMWRFLRDSNILTSEFSLANFNRIFFKGPKNYIEMFMVPEDLDQKHVYDYIYLMISKAKEDFMIKHKNYFNNKKGESNYGDNFVETVSSNKETNSNLNNLNNHLSTKNILLNLGQNQNLNYKTNELEINFDIHNKHQVILLRQFYEAIVRIAYMKYFHVNQPLFVKLKGLIENCIKLNPNFIKKTNVKKSVNNITTETSFNGSVLDMKVKSYENSLDVFLNTYEISLRSLFRNLYAKSTSNPKKYDMTITFRFFYENIILKSERLKEFLTDKYKFIGLINVYHKDKIIITEDNKNSRESFAYVENILDCEFIFFEFCEMIFYISRKYFINFNIKENYIETIQLFNDLIEKCENVGENLEKINYKFPTLPHHIVYNNILANKRQREEEEKRKQFEVKRFSLERKLMIVEDVNVIPERHSVEEEEEEEEYDDGY